MISTTVRSPRRQSTAVGSSARWTGATTKAGPFSAALGSGGRRLGSARRYEWPHTRIGFGAIVHHYAPRTQFRGEGGHRYKPLAMGLNGNLYLSDTRGGSQVTPSVENRSAVKLIQHRVR